MIVEPVAVPEAQLELPLDFTKRETRQEARTARAEASDVSEHSPFSSTLSASERKSTRSRRKHS